MIKTILMIALIGATSICAYSQENVGDVILLSEVPESIALVQQAEAYTSAVVGKDYDKVMSLTHSDIVEKGGGADFLIQDLKVNQLNLENQGLTLTSAEVGSHPEFMKAGTELQTILPVKFYLDMGGKKVESWTNLFAVSADEGKTWKFVDLEKYDDESIRVFIDNISPEFSFPR